MHLAARSLPGHSHQGAIPYLWHSIRSEEFSWRGEAHPGAVFSGWPGQA
jgi:hypothetical protein